MSPTIVLGPDSTLRLVVGSRGGATIITQVLQVVSNVIDHDMGLRDAVAAPRIHHQALPDAVRVDRGGFVPEVLDSLRAMGYERQGIAARRGRRGGRADRGGMDRRERPEVGGRDGGVLIHSTHLVSA